MTYNSVYTVNKMFYYVVTQLLGQVHLLSEINIWMRDDVRVPFTCQRQYVFVSHICSVLSDLQNDKSVGSLILGPDGEIIQLSLHDNSQEPPQGDSDTQQQGTPMMRDVQEIQNLHTYLEERLTDNVRECKELQ